LSLAKPQKIAIKPAEETAKLNHAYHFLEFWKWRAVKDIRTGEPELVGITIAFEWYMHLNSVQVQERVRACKQNHDPRDGMVLESASVRHWHRYSSSMIAIMAGMGRQCGSSTSMELNLSPVRFD
jgi:hypothetical protein